MTAQVTAKAEFTRRQAVRRLVSGMLIMLLAACGKKSPPKPPEGEEVTYPRTYPRR